MKLERPLHNIRAVIQVAGLSSVSSTEVIEAINFYEQPDSLFKMNGMDKLVIRQWIRKSPCPEFTTTSIQDLHALKDLSSGSLCPPLGLDSSMPQYRLLEEIPHLKK